MLFAVATSAMATTPATVEQILCSADSMVRATIVDARVPDCDDKRYFCDHVIEVDFKLKHILKNGGGLTVGDVVTAHATYRNEVPMKVGSRSFAMNHAVGQFSFPASGRTLASREVRDGLVGRTFVFGITEDAYWPGHKLQALVWPLAEIQWIETMLAEPDCAAHRPAWRPLSRTPILPL